MYKAKQVDTAKSGDMENNEPEKKTNYPMYKPIQPAGMYVENSDMVGDVSGNIIPQNDQVADANNIIRLGLRLGVTAALHPMEYAKVLMQLGYEPIPPRIGTSIFRRKILIYPNVFRYTKYIAEIDGWQGCYRGLMPRLIGTMVSTAVSASVADQFGLSEPEGKKKEDIIEDEELYQHFKYSLKRDIVVTVTSIVVSQPFQVISIRMMAQFIGRETLYSTIKKSIKEIFHEEGIFGFFSGLMPKILCEVACVVLTSSTVYLLNKYLIKDKIGRQYNAALTQFAILSLFYPLQVVATCMAVTGSRLAAGEPPITPLYNNWLDCWNDLQARGELKRGSSLFWRTMSAQTYAKIAFAPTLPLVSRYN